MSKSTMTTDTMRQTLFPASPALRAASRHLPALFLLASVLVLASGCLYRMDITQGNYLDPSQVVRLENGMTKSQVKFLLGTPMLPNGFDADRWNYFLYEKAGNKVKPTTARVTIWFKDDKVDHFVRPDNTEELAARMAAQNEAAMKSQDAVLPAPRSTLPQIPSDQPRRAPRGSGGL